MGGPNAGTSRDRETATLKNQYFSKKVDKK